MSVHFVHSFRHELKKKKIKTSQRVAILNNDFDPTTTIVGVFSYIDLISYKFDSIIRSVISIKYNYNSFIFTSNT